MSINKNRHFLEVGFFLPDAGADLAGTFLDGALGLVAAVFAFVEAVDPVTAFFAVPRLATVVVFFAGATFLPARTFLGGAAFALTGAGLAAGLAAAVLVVVDDLLAATAVLDFVVDDLAAVEVAVVLGLGAGFFTVLALVEAVLAVFDFGFAGALGLAAGLFSFVADVSCRAFLGGSFTRPEGPLGKMNVPFSAPVAMARLNWVF